MAKWTDDLVHPVYAPEIQTQDAGAFEQPQVQARNFILNFVCNCNSIEQVSKYEKFGYGCMVTQLASTVAGIAELNHCGKIFFLCTCTSSRATLQKNLTIPKNDHNIIIKFLSWMEF